ncbi:MAG: putative translation initiation factor, family protein, partial [Frankiales bacterium]|nr:putative translation initiation factor, family protein [Frankiales bacterium]
MNVLTVPKKAAALEYSLLRLPATLVESQVVVRFLQDDSALRLGFERALGSLDEKAGRLLGDQALTARGSALRRRSDALADA